MIYPRIFSRIKTKQGQTHCSYKSFLYFLPDIFFSVLQINFFFLVCVQNKNRVDVELCLLLPACVLICTVS